VVVVVVMAVQRLFLVERATLVLAGARLGV
jgi:hypothetical protein